MKPDSISNKAAMHLTILCAVLFATLAVSGQGSTRVESSSPAKPVLATPADLAESIRQRIQKPEVRRGQIGIKVVSLASGKVILEENADKYFMPASNMKSFTVATAIEKLSPDFRFVTPVFATSMPDADGTVRGPVRILGRGDVSVSYTFNEGDHLRGIDRLASALVASGIRKIDGDIIGDETYFTGDPLPSGWEWDDLQFYYGAEVSALPVNDNVVALRVTPGPVGFPCGAKLTPAFVLMRVVNSCVTTASGTRRTLRIHKPLGQNVIEISGELPLGNQGFDGFVAVTRPAEMFVALLKQRLVEKGVVVTGRAVAVNSKSLLPADTNVEIAKIESPPLALIAAKTMKPSQNMYTETLLWTLGEETRRKLEPAAGPSRDSSQLGIDAVKGFMAEVGAGEESVMQYDGSGLSRHNLITPDAVVRLYTYMATKSRYSQTWHDSLTIGGVDGTLRNRFIGTKGASNVRGKTGTINQVSALSGYVTSAGGDRLVFSVLVNGVAETRTRVALIDEIVLDLANFTGKID